MRLMKAIPIVLAILLAAISFSANISGTFYSAYTMKPVDGQVILEVKGPVDYKAAFIGNYSVGLATGNYSMEAYTLNRTLISGPKNVNVENDSRLDFTLSYADTIEAAKPMDWKTMFFAGSILFIIIAIIIFILTGKKEQLHEAAVEGNRGLSEDEDRFLLILYENEGMIEKTELMAQASWSEAKASLLARSLESQGYVKRIRNVKNKIVKTTEKGDKFNRQRSQ